MDILESRMTHLMVVCCLTVLISATTFAQAPDLINYQGSVRFGVKSNVNQVRSITFGLFDAPSEGNLLWSETHSAVQISNGRFSVLLGGGVPAVGKDPIHSMLSEALVNQDTYLEFSVDDHEPLTFRQRLSSTAHAFSAVQAVNAIHGVPAGTIMPFAGGTVPYGWLLCDGQTYQEASYPELFAVLAISAWGNASDDTEFTVPNFGGRIPVGAMEKNDDNDDIAPFYLGVRRGKETHKLGIKEMPRHDHNYKDEYKTDKATVIGAGNNDPNAVRNNLDERTRDTESKGGDQHHNNIQPSAVVRYIIKW